MLYFANRALTSFMISNRRKCNISLYRDRPYAFLLSRRFKIALIGKLLYIKEVNKLYLLKT